MPADRTPRTDRPLRAGGRPPVRAAHLGLGAFHRSHQAWYTHHAAAGADPADGWGIAAFTGRSPAAARALAAQDGRYTLITRGPVADTAEVIGSIVAAHDGGDAAAWGATIADPDVAVLTVTITEAGYASGAPASARIAAGLDARRRADAGPFAVVGCDNILGNGRRLRDAVLAQAAPELAEWIVERVSFVDTMVDRITPATADADRATARELTGFDDRMPVVAEPFAEWVLAGGFPAGRPAWERAGARFVSDVVPYEERKLWLLNAGHSLLAYAGRLRGFETVDEAFADDDLRALVEQLWTEQRAAIDLPEAEVDEALAALRARFANPRIRHSLVQIGRDGAHKLPSRILAPIRRRADRGLPPGDAQRATLDAWAECLVRFGADDEASARIAEGLRGLGPTRRDDLVLTALASEGGIP